MRDKVLAVAGWDGMFGGCKDSFTEKFFTSLAGSRIWKGRKKDFGFCGKKIPVGFFEVKIGFNRTFGLLFVRIREGNKDREMVRIKGS